MTDGNQKIQERIYDKGIECRLVENLVRKCKPII